MSLNYLCVNLEFRCFWNISAGVAKKASLRLLSEESLKEQLLHINRATGGVGIGYLL